MIEPIVPVDYLNQAIALKVSIETNFLLLGEMLKNIRDKKLYNGVYTDFEEYCAELDFTESRASKLITVYDYFKGTLNIEDKILTRAGGWSNLYELYQAADGKPNPETFVNETLNALSEPIMGGRQKLLRQLKKGVNPIDCQHDTYTIKVCRSCAERWRVDLTTV